MAIYVYRAKKGPSEMISGELEAQTPEQAAAMLTENGLFPVSVTCKSGQGKGVQRGFSPRVPVSAVDVFTSQLASMIRARVSIVRALSLISQQTEKEAFRGVVNGILVQIKDGRTFSESLAVYPGVFDSLFIGVIKAGEKSGALEESLDKLADYRRRREELRRKVQAAAAYPLFIAGAGIVTIFVMIVFFLPRFTFLFENTGRTLPFLTRVFIDAGKFLSGKFYWFAAGAACISALFFRLRQGSKKKFFVDLVMLHTPFIRNFVRDAEIATFAGTLSMLIRNGISVYESLELAIATLGNEALKETLTRCAREIVTQGITLSQGLRKTMVFPPYVISMITVGEESGNLDACLREISRTYEERVEQAVKISTSLLEPLLILGVGLVVGCIVFAMLLPIFTMADSVQ